MAKPYNERAWKNTSLRVTYFNQIEKMMQERPELEIKSVSSFVNQSVKKELERIEKIPMFDEVISDIDVLKTDLDSFKGGLESLNSGLDEIKSEIRNISLKFTRELNTIKDTIAKAEVL